MRPARGLTTVAMGMTVCLAVPSSARAGEVEGLTVRGVRCGDTVSRCTRLTADLSCPGTDRPALRVVGKGVVLDLGGHSVRRSGPKTSGSEGIVVLADSMVRNGTIRGFELGYVLDADSEHSPEHVWLSRLSFIDNGAAVYNRSASATFTVSNSRFLHNGSGLSSEQDASDGTFEVRSSVFQGNGLALSANLHSVDVADSSFIQNELVFWCPYGNVSFTSSWLVRNEAVGRLPAGEFGYGFCGTASFSGTVISGNGSLAPADQPAWEPFTLVLRDSWLTGNGVGLRVRTKSADVQGSTWWGNGSGLMLEALPDYGPLELTGSVRGNRFVRNRGDGLRVVAPNSLTVSRNAALENTGWGLYAPGAIDGGGNIARGNGAGDCAGLVCGTPLVHATGPGGLEWIQASPVSR